jgi:hypothetical protein
MTDDSEITVRLYRNLFPVARCKANSLGLLGMQIDSGPLRYPKGTQVEVELSVNELDTDTECRLPAVVTNHANGEMGITFLQHDMKTNAQLLKIIAHTHVQVAEIE